MSLLMLLLVLLVVAAVFGSWGGAQPWGGPLTWSPLGLVLLVLLILWLTGNLNGLDHVHRWR